MKICSLLLCWENVLSLLGAAYPAIAGSTPTETVKSHLYVCSLQVAYSQWCQPPGAGRIVIVLWLGPGSLQACDESVLVSHTKLATVQFRDLKPRCLRWGSRSLQVSKLGLDSQRCKAFAGYIQVAAFYLLSCLATGPQWLGKSHYYSSKNCWLQSKYTCKHFACFMLLAHSSSFTSWESMNFSNLRFPSSFPCPFSYYSFCEIL